MQFTHPKKKKNQKIQTMTIINGFNEKKLLYLHGFSRHLSLISFLKLSVISQLNAIVL